LTIAERHYKVLMAGVDQFGGNNDAAPVLEAYQMGVAEHGEDFMRKRFEASAIRLLRNIFHVGLFENPYINIDSAKATVGKPEFMEMGYQAQLKSIVLLKNQNNTLPLKKGTTAFIPKRKIPARRGFFGVTPERIDYPVNMDIAGKYFKTTDQPEEADFALVIISSPEAGPGYDKSDVVAGGNGYLPISLQYRDYLAKDARNPSMAGGDPFETFTNRSYRGKRVKSANSSDLDLVEDTYQKMKGKPVIVIVRMTNPTVFSEFESKAKALLVEFEVQDQALFEMLSGAKEPSGLLPIQMPENMSTVESQFEDVSQDMKCFVDQAGNVYDFGFGLNWSGVIKDDRVAKYKR
jgi:beta-glucosidase